jgi:hypothetical protein
MQFKKDKIIIKLSTVIKSWYIVVIKNRFSCIKNDSFYIFKERLKKKQQGSYREQFCSTKRSCWLIILVINYYLHFTFTFYESFFQVDREMKKILKHKIVLDYENKNSTNLFVFVMNLHKFSLCWQRDEWRQLAARLHGGAVQIHAAVWI